MTQAERQMQLLRETYEKCPTGLTSEVEWCAKKLECLSTKWNNRLNCVDPEWQETFQEFF